MLTRRIISPKMLSALLGFLFALLTTNSALAYHFPWDQSHDVTRPEQNEEPPGPCEGICDECNATASPVYVPTGHFIWSETDVSLPGRPGLGLRRAYNSHDPRDGLFGNGWSANCEISVFKTTTVDSATGELKTEYVVLLPNGKRHTYPVTSDGAVETPDGRYDQLEPQADGTIQLTNLDGSYRVFDKTGHITSRVDRNGNAISYEYNDSDQLTRIRDDHGRYLNFGYSLAGRVATITDHSGRQWRYDYDMDGNLIRVTNPEGGERQFDYQQYTNNADGQTYHQLVRITDASGVVVVDVDYNGSRVTSYTKGENRYSYSHNASQKQVVKTGQAGMRRTITYNDKQVITRMAVANGNGGNDTTEYTYDDNGNRTLIVDPAGNQWQYDYDGQGRLLSKSNPLGETTEYTYDGDKPWPVTITSPGGRTVAMTYDGQGNLLTVTDPLNETITMEWSPQGDLIRLTDALGQSTTFSYNATGLVTSITDPEQRTVQYDYDELGRPTRTTQPGGETQTWSYDALGRVVAATNGLGDTSRFSYDPAGRLQTVTDWAGASISFQYDQYGRQVQELRPDGQILKYAYTAANRIASKTNPDGSVINYGYDVKQRLESMSFPGETYEFAYNARDLLISVSQASNGWQSQYTYDEANRLASEAHNGRSIAIDRNVEGEAIRWTVAGEVQGLARNDRGQITALDTPAGSYSFTYDNAGQMTGMNYPGGSASTAYNAAGQTSSQQFGDSLGTQFSYGYDSNGRLDQRQGEGADWQYGYDAANRLTSANHGVDDYGYQYDPNGNRLEGGQQYDDFNKLLSSQSTDYDHDANGNRIRQTDLETGDVTEYGYDALNRLTSAEFYPEGADTPAWNASYQYDAFNRRIGKTVAGNITENTEYLWFGSRLVAEYDSGASTPAKRYRYTENSFAPVSYSEGNNDFAVHSDYLDTPKALTDTSGNVVWNTVLSPYGNTVENTDPDGDGQAIAFNLRFPGQYHDRETGLYYNWNRTYDPESGRYLQSDPLGLYDGPNTYTYVYSNPVNYIDPTGEWGIAGGVYGAISGGIGGYISGGWQGALAGAGTGALVGAVNPFGASAAGAAAGAGVASLLGQGAGNVVSGKDVTDLCNYDYSAAAGAALGGALGGPLGNAIGRYVGPYRYPIIGRSVNAPGISNAPGNTVGSVVEGVSVGVGELGGQQF
ncbi:RHS repeat-associated core domain-containing protein [Marinobacter nauticus]|uniref:RHS repeat-associated protein n=1 Tax=Marinobacter nauticus TaxID=2743 RepID=A0A368VC13_MARNT|nr:RHS repeat-associated core domain-containing protein [Marinobacter nauticus]RBP75692.1 RHS repeat-associated protein [Marinobacter nauticus]RCW36501.1 RHS repeat-associated protein [Marinobacter nauticus]